MKACIVSLLLLFTSSSPEWLHDFNVAKETARSKNQYILLNFSGSDWCAPCIRLKRDIFSSEVFINYAAENLVLMNADFPRLKKNKLDPALEKKNEQLAEQYNPHGKFPYTILLDAQGKVVTAWEGNNFNSPEAFVDLIKTHIVR